MNDMDERHFNREKYFQEQSSTTEKYIIPYINELLPITPDLTIAEIGCGEGGNLKPFLDIGCKVTGIDLAEDKIANANKYFSNHTKKNNLTLITEDIYKLNPDIPLSFDLIIMRDTLEHIHDQDSFLEYLKIFMNPEGKIFIAFPPWRMPFGGHQQMCENDFLNKLPYFHLFPNRLYIKILKLFGENEARISALSEIKSTGISISGFRDILNKRNYKINKETLYLINPNYEIKFKIKPRRLPKVLHIPYLKDFLTTTYYCIISL
jgi:SAM-dependent methyltransferase